MVITLLSFIFGAQVPATAADDLVKAEALIQELKSFKCPSSDATSNPCSLTDLTLEPKFYSSSFAPMEGWPAKKTINPAMKELVRMGVRALPKLLEHIDDKHQTAYTITHNGGFGGMWHAAEYDARFHDPSKQPKTELTAEELKELTGRTFFDFTPLLSYRVTVGDLCYAAIGQVVNRYMSPMRPQPTMCIVLNSPSTTPRLAAAVRQDWTGLTAAQHQAQLEMDVAREAVTLDSSALQRLMFYYPDAGKAWAVRLLNRNLYSYAKLWSIEKEMYESDNPKVWSKVNARIQKEFGKAIADANAQGIHYSFIERFGGSPEDEQKRARATKILAAVYPNYKPYVCSFVDHASLLENRDVLGALHAFPSKAVDHAAHGLFRRATREPAGAGRKPMDEEDATHLAFAADEIALRCYLRNRGKGWDAEYLAYFKQRLKSNPKTRYGNEEGNMKMMKEIVAYR